MTRYPRLRRNVKFEGRVTEIAKVPLPVNKPIVGERAFTRESGLGLDLVFGAPLAMFCLKPAYKVPNTGRGMNSFSFISVKGKKCFFGGMRPPYSPNDMIG